MRPIDDPHHALGADKPLWEGEDDDWMGWYQLAEAY